MSSLLAHCWYSPTQDQQNGHTIYLIDGVEKKVTNASHLSNKNVEGAKLYNAADSVYLGIGDFVRGSEKWREFCEKTFPWVSFETSLEEQIQATKNSLAALEKLKTHHQEN